MLARVITWKWRVPIVIWIRATDHWPLKSNILFFATYLVSLYVLIYCKFKRWTNALLFTYLYILVSCYSRFRFVCAESNSTIKSGSFSVSFKKQSCIDCSDPCCTCICYAYLYCNISVKSSLDSWCSWFGYRHRWERPFSGSSGLTKIRLFWSWRKWLNYSVSVYHVEGVY